MAKSKKAKTETKTEYTHRSVTDNKAGHTPVPTENGSWSAEYQTCEICGRQMIEKTS